MCAQEEDVAKKVDRYEAKVGRYMFCISCRVASISSWSILFFSFSITMSSEVRLITAKRINQNYGKQTNTRKQS